jgi:hypothetical protein
MENFISNGRFVNSMKSRPPLITFGIGLLAATLGWVATQQRQLTALRTQAHELQVQAAAISFANATSIQTNATPAAHSPSLELLQLRSQVGQLERLKRELSAVPAEQRQLHAQAAGKSTNTTPGVPLPAGYLRKSEAKLAGFGSPEDALQSFLWAIQNRNIETLLRFFGPEAALALKAEIERRGGATDEFFRDSGIIPGLLIKGREPKDDGTIVLNIQIVPNDEATAQVMRFKQFEGEWKLISGL